MYLRNVFLAAIFTSVAAFAQTADAPFQVKYAANLNIGESYINITNTGANGAALLGPGFGTQAGNICVNVYAFDPAEELISCCSCLVTPDQTVNLGVNRDLTVKTLTGVIPTSVTVKVLATLAGASGGGTTCTNSAATVTARIGGYRDALFTAGISLANDLVRTLDNDQANDVQMVMETLKPEGIVCANDRTAGHLMHGLIQMNYRIPQDVRVVGIDDVEYASLLPVPLTTVHQPCKEIGVAAVAAMLERVAAPDMPIRDILLDCSLVVRDSCGKGNSQP